MNPKYMATHVRGGGGGASYVPGTDISLQKDLLEEIGLAQMARQRSGPHSLAKREFEDLKISQRGLLTINSQGRTEKKQSFITSKRT